MPQTTLEFWVNHSATHTPNTGNTVRISSVKLFWEIADLGFEDFFGVGAGKPGGSLKISGSESDPKVQAALERLARSGMRPSEHFIVPIDERFTRFTVVRRRTYNHKEICDAPLLRLTARFSTNVFADWCGGSDEHGWCAEKIRKNKKLIGHFNSLEVLLVRDQLKQEILSAGLRMCGFLEVQGKGGSAAAEGLWQFGHDIEMPPCLLPLQNDAGGVPLVTEKLGRYWNDSGFVPPELVFTSRDLERMQPWDAARTIEKVGSHSRHYHSEVIVSQAFREFLERASVETVNYVPVRVLT